LKLWLVLLLLPAFLQADEQKSKGRPRAMGELTLRLIEADSAVGGPNDATDMVPAELKALLRFTRYRLLDAAYLRGTEDQAMRVALAGGLSGRVRFQVRARQPVVLLEFDVEIEAPAAPGEKPRRLLETMVTARSGETMVLGASRMRDSSNALIVLLVGKLLP
jgi:hypothetical protein